MSMDCISAQKAQASLARVGRGRLGGTRFALRQIARRVLNEVGPTKRRQYSLTRRVLASRETGGDPDLPSVVGERRYLPGSTYRGRWKPRSKVARAGRTKLGLRTSPLIRCNDEARIFDAFRGFECSRIAAWTSWRLRGQARWRDVRANETQWRCQQDSHSREPYCAV